MNKALIASIVIPGFFLSACTTAPSPKSNVPSGSSAVEKGWNSVSDAPLHTLSSTISESDVAWAKTGGGNTVYGSAYITVKHSGFTYSVDRNTPCTKAVELIPRTPYSDEIMQTKYGEMDSGFLSWKGRVKQAPNGEWLPLYTKPLLGKAVGSAAALKGTIQGVENPIYRSSIKVSDCDQDGNFVFDNVADGEYYLESNVTTLPRGGTSRVIDAGGDIMRLISVKGGERKRVILKH